jgi:hypothetical protein
MTEQTDDELAEARRDYNAAQWIVASFTADRALVSEVFGRLAANGEDGCMTALLARCLPLIVEKTDLVELEPIIVVLRGYIGRLVTRFGESLDTNADEQVDPAELDAALRRFLDDAGGAP